MRIEILTIGDEILIGQITNTNSVWIAQQANLMGMKVAHMTSVSDERQAILDAFAAATTRADMVFITGGLGPTKDDITKKTFCDFFGTDLVIDEASLANVTEFFAKRNRPLTEINRKQAEVPRGCKVILNKNGTAPGMWMEKNNTVYISMPGVPHEMKLMMSEQILPEIRQRYPLPHIYHKTILTQGIGESVLAEKIEVWEDQLAAKGIRLAYLPSPGLVRLRLSSDGADEAELKQRVEAEVESLVPQIRQYIYGYEEYGKEQPTMEKIVGELLLSQNKRLALAESCTGGYISHLITSIAGSSAYFNGAVIPYHNEFKHSLLSVDTSIFSQFGAVSRECVEEMAVHVRKRLNADVSIAVSGIAGPAGGTDEKPVGTVWIAVADAEKVIARKFLFGSSRSINIQMSAITALNMLRKLLLDELETETKG